MTETVLSAKAFNEGSDARLAGEPLEANPYKARRTSNAHRYWRMGWFDMDQCLKIKKKEVPYVSS